MNKEYLEEIQETIIRRIKMSEVMGGLTSSDKKLIDLWNYTIELQDKINQLETNRDELKKWLEEEKNKHYDRKWLSDDELCYRLEDNSAKTIIAVQTKIDELERGKEC